jgi:Predicted oxidoreductases of the aldo/keto reductase family
MTIGKPSNQTNHNKLRVQSNEQFLDTAHVRIGDIAGANSMLDVFQKHAHNEIDTARVYGAGTTEEYLAEADWHERGLIMGTKLYPTARRDMK